MSQRQRELISTDALIRTLAEEPLSQHPTLIERTRHLPLELLIPRILEKTTESWHATKRRTIPFFLLGTAGLLGFAKLAPTGWSFIGTLGFLIFLFWLVGQLRTLPGEENALLVLAERRAELGQDEVSLVLARLQSAHSVTGKEAIEAVQALRQWLMAILPRLTEAQCQALTEPEREFLRGMVRRGGPEERVAGLLVLATARDAGILPLAKLLAIDAPDTDERVREAAQEVLRTLWG
ncbi:hypothetical protein [Armatimonas rosea]|uniref:Uncharacterized protein n=1 Tax=Armatimonas rosea TaxID=685828 RepID=A0A7W9W9X4_ARMRO|nr:hypothetical protein [Armatimonas rosea]MBB6052982.1 hypothetical protein [Armatimonas rosea]